MRNSTRSEVDPFIVMDVMEAARKAEEAGRRIIHMEVGQPSTGAPEAAQQALARKAKQAEYDEQRRRVNQQLAERRDDAEEEELERIDKLLEGYSDDDGEVCLVAGGSKKKGKKARAKKGSGGGGSSHNSSRNSRASIINHSRVAKRCDCRFTCLLWSCGCCCDCCRRDEPRWVKAR